MTTLADQAAQAGIDSFQATMGHFPDRFRLLHAHAPGAFAGYGLIRSSLMQDPPAGHLDVKAKELVFTALCTLAGDKYGAISHAVSGMRLGLTLGEVAEVIVQAIMVGGITTWNLVGYDVMQTCEDFANGIEPPSPG